jgi:hypothetical protein
MDRCWRAEPGWDVVKSGAPRNVGGMAGIQPSHAPRRASMLRRLTFAFDGTDAVLVDCQDDH